ncbi:MAG TPA: ribonuclease P protein component [Candidatus Andersenbacteria bacterium]|nr:ribonuclease P protein component [Candidatus Andersenbacteria bacterium]
MLTRKHRLAKQADITRTLRQGRVVSTPYVRMYAVARPAGLPSRAACVVSKRIHSSAVHRHRYQRYLRAAAQRVIAQLKTPYDMVWVGQEGLREVTGAAELYGKIKSSFVSLISR